MSSTSFVNAYERLTNDLEQSSPRSGLLYWLRRSEQVSHSSPNTSGDKPDWLVIGAAAVGAVLAAVLVGLVLIFVQLTNVQASECHQIELVKARIRNVVLTADQTAGKPGSAGYDYYFAHPGALAAEHVAAKATLQQFAPSPC